MSKLDTTRQLIADIVNEVIRNEKFSMDDHFACYNAIEDYLKSEEYFNKFMADYKVFKAAEDQRKAAAKTAADEEKKRTGKEVKPVDIDPNEHNQRDIPGSDLYCTIKEHFESYLNNLLTNDENLQGERFMEAYATNWARFQLITKILDAQCANLNKNWIQRNRSEGRHYIHEIYVLAMNLWNRTFFERSTTILTEKCLELIRRDRDGETIDKMLLKHVIQSYISVGASVEDSRSAAPKNTLRLYRTHFEPHFLRATEEYYRIEADRHQESDDISSYIQMVLRRIEQEGERVERYLHETTRPALLTLLDKLLIVPRLQEIQGEIIRSIEVDGFPGLHAAYRLLTRVANAIDPVANHLEGYVARTGAEAINDVAPRALTDPPLYVETILGVYRRFKAMVEQGFENDPKFLKSLGKALVKIVNTNAVITNSGQATKSAELLVLYCDVILRKGEKATGGVTVHGKLDEIMIVFDYIEDKDAFQHMYTKKLERRLITDSSASDEYEEYMISKLKSKCGHHYTAKMQRMFQDMHVSETISDQFRDQLTEGTGGQLSPRNFTLMVLTANYWSLSSCAPFTLPRELATYVDTFTAYYMQKFAGRTLSWVHQHSRCELSITINKKKYLVTASVLQATIFFLFNQAPSWSIRAIEQKTGLAQNLLLCLVLGLIQDKVVHCPAIAASQPLDDLEPSDLEVDYEIQLSTTYRNERPRINIIRPIRVLEQREREAVDKEVEEGRRHHMRLAIVQIMKAHRELLHDDLVREATSKLLQRFVPKRSKIEACIIALIDEEYLRRDENQMAKYHYMT